MEKLNIKVNLLMVNMKDMENYIMIMEVCIMKDFLKIINMMEMENYMIGILII